MSNIKLHPLVTLAFGALCISFAPVFVKMLKMETLGATAIGFWRVAFGSLFLFLWAIIKGEKLTLSKPVFMFAILAGFFFSWDLFVWHRSIFYVGAGIATILGNSQVFWLGLLGVLLFKEKVSALFGVALIMALVGVTLLVGVGSLGEFSNNYMWGIIFGLLTGVFYSSYVISLKKAGHRENKFSFIVLMAWASFFCAVFLLLIQLFETTPFIPPDSYSWLTLIGLAFVAQTIGWWVISYSLPKLRASQSGMVLLLQPTLATVWGALFFAEKLTVLQLLGAVLTLTAIYIGSVRKQ